MTPSIRTTLAALALGLAANAHAATLAERDIDFARKAAAGNLAEMELAQLAQRKGMHGEVQRYAQRMQREHEQSHAKLRALADEKRIALPPVFSEDARERIVELNGKIGPEFDRAYMEQQLEMHRETLERYREQAEDGEDPGLRQYAANTLRTLQAHANAALATRDVVVAGERTGDREVGSRKH